MSKKKKGEAPKSSPKHANAELRKRLFSGLEEVEKDTRALLDSINKLRHGNLDYLSQLETMYSDAVGIGEQLHAFKRELDK